VRALFEGPPAPEGGRPRAAPHGARLHVPLDTFAQDAESPYPAATEYAGENP